MCKDLEVFEASFIPEPNTGCWLWFKYTMSGYGSMATTKKGKRRVLAHRWSYEYFKGQIPKGMLVCHKCDVRPCVNPDHLFLGTHQDNSNDMVIKNRNRIKKKSTILDPSKVKQIRSLLNKNTPIAKISDQFGTSKSAIWDIKLDRRWKWVE